MHRRVFLITESDECLIGTVKDILTEGNVPGAHTANSVIRGIVEEMVFGDFECTNEEQRISIQIR